MWDGAGRGLYPWPEEAVARLRQRGEARSFLVAAMPDPCAGERQNPARLPPTLFPPTTISRDLSGWITFSPAWLWGLACRFCE
jgi:hypothetical protein